MPSNRAQAAYKHRHSDGTPNIEVQREFERLYKHIEKIQEKVEPTPTPEVYVPKTESSVPTITPDAYNMDIVVSEFAESEDYVINGVGETIQPAIQEISNRQPVFPNKNFPVGTSYPQSNNGDGWIPIRADNIVYNTYDDSGVVKIVPSVLYEHITVGPFMRDVFSFTAPKPGLYSVRANVFIRGVCGIATNIPSPGFMDSIDKGMLIIQRGNFNDMLAGGYTNPLERMDGSSGLFEPIDEIYTILDMRSRMDDLNSDRNLAVLNTYDQNYCPMEKYGEFLYGDRHGTPYAMSYNRTINLQGDTIIYLEGGQTIEFWYKLYTRRIEHDTDTAYHDQYIDLDIEQNVSSYPTRGGFLVENRYEKVEIKFLREIEVTENKQSVREIVAKF